jgi:hypothetical protein
VKVAAGAQASRQVAGRAMAAVASDNVAAAAKRAARASVLEIVFRSDVMPAR